MLEHHRVDAGRAEGDQAMLGTSQQLAADATPTGGRGDRETVEVRSPSVVAGDDRADDAALEPRDDERVGVAREQARDRVGSVGRAAVVLARLGPEREQFGDVASRCRTVLDAVSRLRPDSDSDPDSEPDPDSAAVPRDAPRADAGAVVPKPKATTGAGPASAASAPNRPMTASSCGTTGSGSASSGNQPQRRRPCPR